MILDGPDGERFRVLVRELDEEQRKGLSTTLEARVSSALEAMRSDLLANSLSSRLKWLGCPAEEIAARSERIARSLPAAPQLAVLLAHQDSDKRGKRTFTWTVPHTAHIRAINLVGPRKLIGFLLSEHANGDVGIRCRSFREDAGLPSAADVERLAREATEAEIEGLIIDL